MSSLYDVSNFFRARLYYVTRPGTKNRLTGWNWPRPARLQAAARAAKRATGPIGPVQRGSAPALARRKLTRAARGSPDRCGALPARRCRGRGGQQVLARTVLVVCGRPLPARAAGGRRTLDDRARRAAWRRWGALPAAPALAAFHHGVLLAKRASEVRSISIPSPGRSGMLTRPDTCSIGCVRIDWRKGCSERSNSSSGSVGLRRGGL